MSSPRLLLLLSLFFGTYLCQCPWDDASLVRWSSYGPTSSSSDGSDVVLDNVRILLDVSTPRLNTLSITNGGSLVWDDTSGLELVSSWVNVASGGSFIVGSESCPFDKKATITLVGDRDTAPSLSQHGQKVLGVSAGGTLELHGAMDGPSWTKLDGTVLGPSTMSSDGRGINVLVVDSSTGSVLHDGHYDTYGSLDAQTDLASLLSSLPQGCIVATAVKDSAVPSSFDQALVDAFEGLGSTLASSITSRDSWGFVATVPASTVAEQRLPEGSGAVTLSHAVQAAYSPGPVTVTVYSAGWSDGNDANAQVASENPIVTMVDPVDGWSAGDEVVLVSTDYNPHQAEQFSLLPCPECSAHQVKLDGSPAYTHYGRVDAGVDMRGEVGHLTRNIVIRGETAPSCDPNPSVNPILECEHFGEDTFGGHTKVLAGFDAVRIAGVEFHRMGQQILGAYPIHFHLAGDVDALGGYSSAPTYVRGNSIHHSFSRCVTIHGTHGLEVDNNVAYRHYGHCYFFEDGIEQRNVLTRNLGALTLPGSLLPTDRSGGSTGMCGDYCAAGATCNTPQCNAVSTFWIENPNNVLDGNVAAGSVETGFWYAFPSAPTGPSEAEGAGMRIRYTPLSTCDNNVAHSNLRRGFFFDNGVKDTHPPDGGNEEYLSLTSMRYRPHENSDPAMPRVPAVIRNLTTYKNRDRGVWVRGGDFRFENYYSAEQSIGMTLASEGTYPNDRGSSQQLHGGTFVGKSGNVGSDDGMFTWINGRTRAIDRPHRGFEFYDGPVVASQVSFYNFTSDDDTVYSGIGWLMSNNWQHSPHSYVEKACWDEDSNRVHFDIDWANYDNNRDGDRNSIFMDRDGTTTGVPGAHVVPNTPYFTNDLCTAYPEWNNGSVCYSPEGWGFIYLTNANSGGTNFDGTQGGATFIRDDASDYGHALRGIPTSSPTTRFQTPVMYDHSYTVHFPHPTPPRLQMSMVNWAVGRSVRIGICVPTDANIDVLRRVYNPGNGDYVDLSSVPSVDQLDENSYHFDTTAGLLFVLATTDNALDDTFTYCLQGTGSCEYIDIQMSGGGVGSASGDCSSSAYPTYSAEPIQHDQLQCPGSVDEQTGECMEVTEDHCLDEADALGSHAPHSSPIPFWMMMMM